MSRVCSICKKNKRCDHFVNYKDGNDICKVCEKRRAAETEGAKANEIEFNLPLDSAFSEFVPKNNAKSSATVTESLAGSKRTHSANMLENGDLDQIVDPEGSEFNQPPTVR